MPNYNLNYIGSSGYGVLPGGRYGRLTTTPNRTPNPTPAYAVWDASQGRAINVRTREIFNGVDPMTGQTFQNGIAVPKPPQNPNAADRYQPVEVVRSPATAQATNDLMEQFRRNADSAMEDFGSLTNQFQQDLTAARTQSREATDIRPTVDALSTAQQEYSGELDTADARYRQAMEEAAARQRGVVQEAVDTLPAYDTALNNTLANQLAAVQRNVSRYKMGTGTPRSLGSAESQILARAATEAALPIEMARIGRRYDILTGMSMPTESAIAGRDIAYAGGFLPSTAGSRYASATTLASTVQNLRQQVAGMSYADAVNFLRASGIPAEIANQILAGEAGTLGMLNQLEEASRYRGLQDTQGVEVTQPIGYNFSLPEYPSYPTRYPTSSAVPSPTPQAPVRNFGFTGLGPDGVGVRYRGLAENAPVIVNPAPENTRYRLDAQGRPVAFNTYGVPRWSDIGV